MGNDFRSEFYSILNKLESHERLSVENKVNRIIEHGIDSQQRMLQIVANPEANQELRMTICQLLLYFDETVVVSPMIAILANDEEPNEIRKIAADVLGYFHSPKTLEIFSQLLVEDKDEEVRRISAYALGKIVLEKLSKKDNHSLIATLINQFRQPDESPKVRAELAEALAYANAKQAVGDLVIGLNDRSAEVRFWSAFALGHLGNADVIPALETIADDENIIEGWWTVAKEATDAIDHIRNRE